MRMDRPLLCAVLLTAVFQAVGEAQIAADLRGRVSDPTGGAVPNATVDLTRTGTDTRASTVTSATGDYSFTNLTPGLYQIDVSANGFQRLTRAGINAIVGQTVKADLVLTVGASQQTVQVTADAPLLQSETSNIETNIP